MWCFSKNTNILSPICRITNKLSHQIKKCFSFVYVFNFILQTMWVSFSTKIMILSDIYDHVIIVYYLLHWPTLEIARTYNSSRFGIHMHKKTVEKKQPIYRLCFIFSEMPKKTSELDYDRRMERTALIVSIEKKWSHIYHELVLPVGWLLYM